MSQDRRRQKKLERHKKNRQLAQRKAQKKTQAQAGHGLAGRLLRLAQGRPFGPAYVSGDFTDVEIPALVTVVFSRQLPDGRILSATALVDRTCLGIKNACLIDPMTPAELVSQLVGRGLFAQVGLQPCEPLLAQSIVFHALDYAQKLGFKPHGDFPADLFGPRPETLLETPWAHPDKPMYFSGPDDDAHRILARLDAAVGRGNYDFMVEGSPFSGGVPFPGGDWEDAEDEEGDDEEEEEEVEVGPGQFLSPSPMRGP